MSANGRAFSIFLASLYLCAAIVVSTCLWWGWSYYQLPLPDRPAHPEYGLFKPSGTIGLSLGMAGTLFMLLLLLYSVRKRTRLFGRLFRLKAWLDVHIFMGIAGPLFITLHTSFKFNGLVSISFWSMVAVALSGVAGRYLYLQIPRTPAGAELDVQVLKDQDQTLKRIVDDRVHKTNPAIARRIQTLLDGGPQKMNFIYMLGADLAAKWRLFLLKRALMADGSLQKEKMVVLFDLLRRKMRLQTRIARLDTIHRFFHHWHAVHRPFALIMYLIMFVHIIVALLFAIPWRQA